MSDQVTAREVAESVVAAWDKRHGYPSNHLTFKQYGSLVDAITAALAAVAGEWRPIETAPKDKKILAWIPWLDGPAAEIIWWNRTCWEMRDRTFMSGCRATHWMPLPTPPAIRFPETAQAGEATEKETDREAR